MIRTVTCEGSGIPGGQFTHEGMNGVTCQVCGSDFTPEPDGMPPNHSIEEKCGLGDCDNPSTDMTITVEWGPSTRGAGLDKKIRICDEHYELVSDGAVSGLSFRGVVDERGITR